jgi:arylformamidase
MEIIDITTVLSSGTVTYPGDPRTVLKSKVKGNSLTSSVRMSLHAGTHLDAPAHYIRGGKTVAEVPLNRLITNAKVLDLTSEGGRIPVSSLRHSRIRKGDTVLLKTRNSRLWADGKFQREYVTLSQEAAYLLAERGVNAVGVDYLSVDKPGEDVIHRTLLQRGVIIIEGLDLSLAGSGAYRLICLPLKFSGTEAAPARCILVK